jgi:hypothetical protein
MKRTDDELTMSIFLAPGETIKIAVFEQPKMPVKPVDDPASTPSTLRPRPWFQIGEWEPLETAK